MKEPQNCKNIEDIREAIDSLDKEIIALLSKRFQYVKEIVKYKAADKDSIIAKERYNAVIKKRGEWGAEHGMDPEVIRKIYSTLLNYFIDEELKIINSH